MMARAGLLSDEQLTAVQATCSERKLSFVEALLAHGFADEDSVVGFLHSKLMIPKVGASVLDTVDKAALARIPGELAARFAVLPISSDETGNLTLAMVDPTDMKAVDAISGHTGAYLVRAVAPLRIIRAAIARHYGIEPPQLPTLQTKPQAPPPPAITPQVPPSITPPPDLGVPVPAARPTAGSAPVVSAPTVSAPTVSAPTVTAPTVSAPTLTAPTVSASTVAPPVVGGGPVPPVVAAPTVSSPVVAPSAPSVTPSAPSVTPAATPSAPPAASPRPASQTAQSAPQTAGPRPASQPVQAAPQAASPRPPSAPVTAATAPSGPARPPSGNVRPSAVLQPGAVLQPSAVIQPSAVFLPRPSAVVPAGAMGSGPFGFAGQPFGQTPASGPLPVGGTQPAPSTSTTQPAPSTSTTQPAPAAERTSGAQTQPFYSGMATLRPSGEHPQAAPEPPPTPAPTRAPMDAASRAPTLPGYGMAGDEEVASDTLTNGSRPPDVVDIPLDDLEHNEPGEPTLVPSQKREEIFDAAKTQTWIPPTYNVAHEITPLSPEAFHRLMPRFATIKSRDEVTDLLLDFLAEGFSRVIMFVHVKGEIRGRDARGEDLLVEAVRQIRIPAGGPSVFSNVIERRIPYFGPMRTDTPIDAAFFSALGGVEGVILVLPVLLRDKVPLIVFASGSSNPVDPRSLQDLTNEVATALERIIVLEKARGPTTK
jgi:hypothetical protein